jgi:cation:H+ antiporter
MWKPTGTGAPRRHATGGDQVVRHGAVRLAAEFAVLAIAVASAGWLIAKIGGQAADTFGISDTAVGVLMTAVATSLPELITTLAAVRLGALRLAVSAIIGGNSFDMLFLTLSDAAYRDGSLYHAIHGPDLFWLGIGLTMTAVLLLGLIVRERRGVAGIGFESAGILAIYIGAIFIQGWVG